MSDLILSNINTIIRSINKLKEISYLNIRDKLIIQILGGETSDSPVIPLNSSDVLVKYQPLFNEIVSMGVNQLTIFFIGPNISPNVLYGYFDEMTLNYQSLNITIYLSISLYHEYFSIHSDNLIDDFNLVFMFNAGLWGYDSWIETLSLFERINPISTRYIVTSYSRLEAEDDFDRIVEVSNNINNKSLKWLWEDEMNPNCSDSPIERRDQSNQLMYYYSNHSWMCYSYDLK